MFYDATKYAFAIELENQWRTIREEYERLQDGSFQDWPEKHIYDQGWQVFPFCFFGMFADENCQRCPRTTEILHAVPGLVTASFSRMAPATHILPHEGYTSDVVRCHLGIVVPANCGIQVGGDSRAWVEGKCLLFDDTVTHEAWNHSATERVVLLLDVERTALCERHASPLNDNQGSICG